MNCPKQEFPTEAILSKIIQVLSHTDPIQKKILEQTFTPSPALPRHTAPRKRRPRIESTPIVAPVKKILDLSEVDGIESPLKALQSKLLLAAHRGHGGNVGGRGAGGAPRAAAAGVSRGVHARPRRLTGRFQIRAAVLTRQL
jgi:hypothetical protein